jgi:hypothetical protein
LLHFFIVERHELLLERLGGLGRGDDWLLRLGNLVLLGVLRFLVLVGVLRILVNGGGRVFRVESGLQLLLDGVDLIVE